MKISLKWLTEYFPNLDFEKDVLPKAAEIKTLLPLSGLEIASIKRLDEGLENVVVGLVQSLQKHPQADKLNVCQVIFETGGAPVQIVCGAPNVRAGMKVAVARVGAVLPGNFEIKAAKIRGVDSNGMICSQKELGLGEEGQGIWHLPESCPLGSALTKAVGLVDQIWETEPTPDRADCLSHLGVAREFGRFLNQKAVIKDLDNLESVDVPLVNVEVQDSKACPIYTAQLFEGVTQLTSPEWLSRSLGHLGIRSHNSVVDVTNYVLMDLGHPLHAFDADKIVGSKIIVRRAKEGESLLCLDGVKRQLTPEDLVIADLEGPLALAGVMGGLHSGVSSETKRFVLESALFDPRVVQATSKRHRIHSDASHRFERGVDPAGVERAAARASFLLKQLSGAKRKGGLRVIKNEKWSFGPSQIHLDLRALKDHTGMETNAEEVMEVLAQVEIVAQQKSANVLNVQVPTHRLDLLREIDLVEEVARLIGYNRIPLVYPVQRTQSVGTTAKLYQKIQLIRRRVLECGLSEVMPYSFISEKDKSLIPKAQLVQLENPLSQDWAFMRPSLSFGLVNVMTRHAAMGQMRGAFFDVGHVFSALPHGETMNVAQEKLLKGMKAHPETGDSLSTRSCESLHIGWAMMGQRQDSHWSSDKGHAAYKEGYDYFDAKAVAEKLALDLSVFDSRWAQLTAVPLADWLDKDRDSLEKAMPWVPLSWLHPYRSAILCLPAKPPGIPVGYVGEIHPGIKNDLLNLPAAKNLSAVMGEVRVIEDLFAEGARMLEEGGPLMNPRGKMKMSRKVPMVERDLALVVDKKVAAAELEKVMRRAENTLLQDLACVDLFQLPDGKVSLAYRLWLQGEEKTLEDQEIQVVIGKVLKAAKDKFGAELR